MHRWLGLRRLALHSLGWLLAMACQPTSPFYQVGHPLFASPQANPLALSSDGTRLYVANTTSGTLSVIDVSTPAAPVEIAEIPVGMDPVGVAVRPKHDPGDILEDEQVFVANHVSDSVSVVSGSSLEVVQTLQSFDADGVSTTNEPVGVVFSDSSRGFVSLDHPNQVLVIDVDAAGVATLSPVRLAIRAQAPRALAASEGRLYVAAFESGNQTEFPSCAPGDPRPLEPDDPHDMGCEFIFDQASAIVLDTVNQGGRVIRDGDLPDRDLFVFDTETLELVDVVEGVGTLLYGVAARVGRIYVTNTDARNDRNGLGELGGRMFGNRLSWVDCASECGAPFHLDLDAAAGIPVPTPYGIAVSGDGSTLLVTAAGSDGASGIPSDPAISLPGLVVLDDTGGVQAELPMGAVPQGVALRSGPDGRAQWAFVLNTVESSVSVVDLSDLSTPVLVATLRVGSDPTPPEIRRGRIAFHAARASTSGNFSCESCHPNGSSDQLLWTINSVQHPDEGPDANGVVADPRVTLAVRGLEGTLPLHWDGSLADPWPGTNMPGDVAPDCSAEDPLGCFRHAVDASLAGVMCDPFGCPPGPNGLPGALDDAERRDLSRFLRALSRPPSPLRRPDGAMSPQALAGALDFMTTDNGLGSSPDGTCATAVGCHELPLLAGTNAPRGGDAPSFLGLWDRFVLFPNGFASSEEVLALMQACADGAGPASACGDVAGAGGPTFDSIWDPEVGMTERGSLLATVNAVDRFTVGLRGPELWRLVAEAGTGLPGLVGRQLALDAASAALHETAIALAELEARAEEGRIVLRAHNGALGDWAYHSVSETWRSLQPGPADKDSEALLAHAATGAVVTITAWPPRGVRPGGPLQPLLSPYAPGAPFGSPPNIPRPPADSIASVRLTHAHVKSNAQVLVDGELCTACSIALGVDTNQILVADILLDPAPGAGPHMLQVRNPKGLESNQMLIVAE